MRNPSLLALLLVVAACSATDEATLYLDDEKALGPYSALALAGDLCFVSGKIGSERDTFETEAASAIDAVAAELARVGLELADVVSSTVYLTDIGNYAAFNKVYGEKFSMPYPARACIAVRALPGDSSVEVQVIARRRHPPKGWMP